jgi:hypothetical protein
MPAKAGMLLKPEMTAAAGTIASSWMSLTVPARIDRREDSNIQQGHQQHKQELSTRTLSNSRRYNRNITDVNADEPRSFYEATCDLYE